VIADVDLFNDRNKALIYLFIKNDIFYCANQLLLSFLVLKNFGWMMNFGTPVSLYQYPTAHP
jgi:hypothetical protein